MDKKMHQPWLEEIANAQESFCDQLLILQRAQTSALESIAEALQVIAAFAREKTAKVPMADQTYPQTEPQEPPGVYRVKVT